MDRLLVKSGGTIVGRVVGDFVLPDRRRIASEHLTLMATSSLEGYNVQAQIRHESGHVLEMPTWVKRLRLEDSPPLAAIVVAPQVLTTKPLDVLTETSEPSGAAFIVTDHDWRVKHRSHETDVFLNYEPLEGSSAGLLGMVHASDAPEFLLAITQAVASRQAAVTRVRLKAHDWTWTYAQCLVTAVCEHEPPRLGLVVTFPETTLGEQTSSQL